MQRVRPVAGPVGALVMEIAAQKGVDALRAMPHLVIGRSGRVVPLVMLARLVKLGQGRVDVLVRRGVRRRRLGGVEGQRRGPGEGRAHQHQRAEHVGPHQRAPGGDPGAEIMADDRRDRRVAEGRDQPQRVAHRVQNAERAQIAVVIGVPPGGAAIAALVGGDHMKPGRGQRRHDPAPGIGESPENRAAAAHRAGPAARSRPPARGRAAR